MFVCFSAFIINAIYSILSPMYSAMYSESESFISVEPSFIPCPRKSPSMFKSRLHQPFHSPVPRMKEVFVQFVQFEYYPIAEPPKRYRWLRVVTLISYIFRLHACLGPLGLLAYSKICSVSAKQRKINTLWFHFCFDCFLFIYIILPFGVITYQYVMYMVMLWCC